ncbi:hypothetical protein C1645_363556 [Glomus cerebriforme]|uniref:Uncharacterized protein n=1 Tax=Glomus cerebriforme TaxID=658196 RepID=A0A397SI25_9GLOM|nr:hypothetical protein C1645_363556 [Glomus cerebriforme]
MDLFFQILLIPSVINNYRKYVWITLMSFAKWHYWIIEAFFDIQKFPRINDLQEPINYLAWLIYPREDSNIMIFSNSIGDMVTSIRDIILGLWSKIKSIEFMEEILNAYVVPIDQLTSLRSSVSRKRQVQTNENINLAALTKIFDYFYENQFEKNDEIKSYLNRLKERYMI